MNNQKLSENQEYVNMNKDMLLNLYKNKYILVYEKEIMGSFDTYEAAAEEGIKAFGINGNFLVHYVTESSPVNFVSVALI